MAAITAHPQQDARTGGVAATAVSHTTAALFEAAHAPAPSAEPSHATAPRENLAAPLLHVDRTNPRALVMVSMTTDRQYKAAANETVCWAANSNFAQRAPASLQPEETEPQTQRAVSRTAPAATVTDAPAVVPALLGTSSEAMFMVSGTHSNSNSESTVRAPSQLASSGSQAQPTAARSSSVVVPTVSGVVAADTKIKQRSNDTIASGHGSFTGVVAAAAPALQAALAHEDDMHEGKQADLLNLQHAQPNCGPYLCRSKVAAAGKKAVLNIQDKQALLAQLSSDDFHAHCASTLSQFKQKREHPKQGIPAVLGTFDLGRTDKDPCVRICSDSINILCQRCYQSPEKCIRV
jgi:hypothetical protein